VGGQRRPPAALWAVVGWLAAAGLALLSLAPAAPVPDTGVESLYLPLAIGCPGCGAEGTRVAHLAATVAVFETILPEVMQTAGALWDECFVRQTAEALSSQPSPAARPEGEGRGLNGGH